MVTMQPKLTSKAYFPMLVPEGDGSLQANLSVWERFDHLSEETKNILVSEEMAWKMKEIQNRFKLNDSGVTGISLVGRKIFFQEVDLAGAEARIGSFLTSTGAGDPNQARAITEFIRDHILTLKPVKDIRPEESDENPVSQKKIQLPLLKAMSEYRHIAEQMLTAEKIKLRGSVELVRPSLGNWLKAYREELGVGFHEPVQRGSFLFQSQNGKRLSSDERARLNLILKSVEEEFPLEIDTEHQTIIFPPSDEAPRRPSQPNVRPINPADLSKRVPESAVIPVSQPSAVKKIVSEPDALSPAQSFRPIFSKPAVPEKNVSGETLHFSTGHVLPAEREASEAASAGNTALRQMQHPTQGIRRIEKKYPPKSPYSIRPLRSQNGSGAA